MLDDCLIEETSTNVLRRFELYIILLLLKFLVLVFIYSLRVTSQLVGDISPLTLQWLTNFISNISLYRTADVSAYF